MKFIFIEKEELYYYKYIDVIDHCNIMTTNIEKDTVEYMMVQCHKTEWIKMAIGYNYFNTDQFVWIDFGIYHIFNNDETLFNDCMYGIKNKQYESVRIACGYLAPHYMVNKVDIYPRIIWCFLGGIFGGNASSLLVFADLMKEKCLYLINDYKILPWEVNVWYLIYFDNPSLFNYYYGDHNYTMIMNY